jgi:hypothetical protein
VLRYRSSTSGVTVHLVEVSAPRRLAPKLAVRFGPSAFSALAAIADLAFAAVDRLPFSTATGTVTALASLTAAWRYSKRRGRLAGPIAAGLSWAGFVVFLPAFGAGFFFLPGALLQTLGWRLSTEPPA